MKNLIYTLLLCAIVLSGRIYAHGDHSTPGAVPPGLYGGEVKEAEHSGADLHHGKGETELFFEVLHKNGTEIQVYPLALPEDAKTFSALPAKGELAEVQLSILDPRSKKVTKLVPNIDEKMISAKFDAKKMNRFIVQVAVVQKKEKKHASIQLVKE